MNKHIKLLVESIFDDEIFTDITRMSAEDEYANLLDEIPESLLISMSKYLKYDKYLESTLNDCGIEKLYNIFKETKKLSDLELKYPVIYMQSIRIALLPTNMDFKEFSDELFKLYKQIFDMLLNTNIKIHVNFFEIKLQNVDKTILYNISDLLNLSIYHDLLMINDLAISYGQLKSLKGCPTNIFNSIDFYAINKIESFEYFPKTAKPLKLIFESSPFPVDWSGINPNLLSITFYPKYNEFIPGYLDRFSKKDFIKKEILEYYQKKYLEYFETTFGDFKNIPQNLNIIEPGIIMKKWPKLIKDLLQDYLKTKLYDNNKHAYMLLKRRRDY